MRAVSSSETPYDTVAYGNAIKDEVFEWCLICPETPLHGFVTATPVVEHLAGEMTDTACDLSREQHQSTTLEFIHLVGDCAYADVHLQPSRMRSEKVVLT